MGNLTSLRLPTKTVAVPGTDQSFPVRGLSLTDAAALVRAHGEALNKVYEERIAVGDELLDTTGIAKAILDAAPLAAAEIIAFAADEPSNAGVEMARRLPAPVQIEALSQIVGLTFHSEIEAKKLLETVLLGSGVLTRMMTTLGTSN